MNKFWALIGLFLVGISGTGTAGIGGGGGSPPAVMELSLAQFNELAQGALRGELLEKINSDGSTTYFEPIQLGKQTMMAKSLEGEGSLILNGVDPNEPSSSAASVVESTDPSINSVPRN